MSLNKKNNKNPRRGPRWPAIACCAVISVLGLSILAQAQGGSTTSISGKITDSQKLGIPGATVKLINAGTGATREALTNEQGEYTLPVVQPGTYTVRIEMPSFKTSIRENVQLLVNTPSTLDITLEVGGSNEIVTVTAEASVINTTDATIGHPFNEHQVLQLPLEGRNPVGLLSLQPGVNASGEVNGSRRDQNNITLDGVDVNDQQSPGAFESVVPLTLDSVQEFRVTTSTMNADQGRSSGGQVSLVTKGGTNKFHGSVYEFHRNTKTTANDFFNNSAGVKRPALLRNVFGGSIGGPVWKDRIFFFANYERRTDRSQTLVARGLTGGFDNSVPSELLKQGTLVYEARAGDPRGVPCPDGSGRMCGVLTPTDLKRLDPLGLGVNPVALAILKGFPAGNDPSVGRDKGLAFNGLRFNSPQVVDQNTYIARMDFDLLGDGKHMVFWRGNLADFVDQTGAQNLPGQPPSQFLLDNSKQSVVGYTVQITPHFLNDFRWGFTRQGLEFTGGQGGKQDSLTFRSFASPISFNRANGRQLPMHNLTDTATWIKGNHTIQGGINFRFIHNNRFTFQNSFVGFTANSGFAGDSLGRRLGDQLGFGAFANFPRTGDRTSFARAAMALLGMINQASGTALFDRKGERIPFGQVQSRRFGVNEYEFFVQDTWKIRPNVSLVAGVRYSNSSVPRERGGFEVKPTVNITKFFETRATNAAKGIPSNAVAPLTFDLSGPANGRAGIFPRDKDNWAPRVALAWSPAFQDGFLKTLFGGPGKTSIRAGYALTYDRIGGAFVVQADLSGSVGLATPFITDVSSLGFGFPNGAAPAPRLGATLPPVQSLATIPRGGLPNTPQSEIAFTGFGVDTQLRTPYTQNWSLSWERELPQGFSVEFAYVGRVGHNLLQSQDLSAPVNLIDPGTGASWFGTLNQILDAQKAGQSITGRLPYVENLFPSLANAFISGSATDNFLWLFPQFQPSFSDLQFFLDNNGFGKFGRGTFFQQQFNSLPFFRSKGNSAFHSLQVSGRKRFSQGVQFDFNYTWGHSIDNGSAIENSGRLGAQIANAFAPRDFIASSSFDVRHNINANWIVDLPFGHSRRYGKSVPTWVNHLIGDWQVSGILRRRSGLPFGVGNGFNFPTNFFLTGPGTQIAPVDVDITKAAPGGPNLFADAKQAIKSFDFTRPGSSGSRNVLRGHRFITLDFGVGKRFRLPIEGHSAQFRWEVFNATNTVSFDQPTLDIENPTTFGRFTAVTGSPRVMQFALRYEF